jgi:hypothetical protein
VEKEKGNIGNINMSSERSRRNSKARNITISMELKYVTRKKEIISCNKKIV